MPYLLAIDSGNSFLKWGIHDGNQWLTQDKVSQDDILLLKDSWSHIPSPTSIIVSCVTHTILRDKLSLLLSIWPIEPRWISALPRQCGVSNGYTDPYQLGSDRWAALVAAWAIQRQSCLVINVGTAMTGDALSVPGKFIGGIILPGQQLMFKSLKANTQLDSFQNGCYEDFPSNSGNAIYNGVLHSLIGAIERMYSLLSLHADQPLGNCIISGGGAVMLLPYIKLPSMIIDNLVLEGLMIIASDTQ